MISEFCKRCNTQVEPVITEQVIADGRTQLRAECPICLRYIKFMPQVKEKKVNNKFIRPTLENVNEKTL